MHPEHQPITEGEFSPSAFGLTVEEISNRFVSNQRLLELCQDSHTVIRDIHQGSNEFGDFLFISLNKPDLHPQKAFAFYSQGFHFGKSDWLTDTWWFYVTYRTNLF